VSVSLKDVLSERCVTFLIVSFKESDTTFACWGLDQPPDVHLEPCARIRNDREVEVADPLVLLRPDELVFDGLKSWEIRNALSQRPRRGRPIRP